ncbi:TrkH family potassium uptake protein [Candidatus Poribacteria bacterium]|nr:TrkH family potassium uptake protein [Candidatus Poribacteria bacterium]MYG07601.1 TrkH family potassium uptake protein [Candidatus Poribacteria bacterium]MYK24913.1 TrkH family potassium uptake protein [Candidatus Poribacteria bacterium]
MSLKLIFYTLGNLLICLAGTMLLPLVVALYYRSTVDEIQSDLMAFVISAVITLIVGLILRFSMRARQEELGIREGFAVVALGWVTVALFGTLPYLFADVFHVDGRSLWTEFSFSYFEAMAGFSTTGATVLTEIEHLSHAMLFWRSFSHWLGGMGIVVLAVAILPMLGIGGMQLFRAEAPGPQTDRLTPRIAQTAKLLWGVYLLLSVLETVLLMLGGMSLFDALCHTFGTMATGGFSTKNASVGHYDSVYIDMVICFFMFLAGTNFALHYRALRGNVKSYFQDTEFKFYCIVIAVSITLISWNTIRFQVDGDVPYDSMWTSLRYAAFQVMSIITTTGYGTADFEQWPALSQFILVTLMFYGGCAGSTGGGMKQVRFLLLIKQSGAEIKRLIFPHAVLPIRVNDRVVPPEVMTNVLGFFFFFIGIFAVVTCIMTTLGLDLVSAAGATIATMGNIGPGLGSVGPTDNYAHIHTTGKFVLSFCMLLGRLELYTVLILFSPNFWKG